jgi:hypothetical protein
MFNRWTLGANTWTLGVNLTGNRWTRHGGRIRESKRLTGGGDVVQVTPSVQGEHVGLMFKTLEKCVEQVSPSLRLLSSLELRDTEVYE